LSDERKILEGIDPKAFPAPLGLGGGKQPVKSQKDRPFHKKVHGAWLGEDYAHPEYRKLPQG
jgi:hypothetical protein